MQKKWRIGIDCRLAGSQHAGIGRYTSNLITELLAIAPASITWVLFFSTETQKNEVLRRDVKNVEIVYAPIRHYSLKEQLQMPQIFAAAKLDLLHVPHFNVPLLYNQPTVVTIHDLLWHEQRGSAVTTLSPLMYWLKYAFYHLNVRHAVSLATTIFVPAETIKHTVIKYYGWAKNKILVTYEGIEKHFLDAAKKSTVVKPPQTIDLIYTGSLYPHKNIEVVLQVLKNHPEVFLTLVGSRNVFRDTVANRCKELGIADRVTFAGYIPDANLTKLYQQSYALIQPSLSEGFGLTGLEALAAGLPAIVSDIPIFREIYDESVLYFDPHQSEKLWQALLELPSKRETLLEKAQVILQRYDWQKMATKTLQAYLKILEPTV